MYEIVQASEPISQGDIIDDCPIVAYEQIATDAEPQIETARSWRFRVILLTQACDLAQKKKTVTRLNVAVIHPLDELLKTKVLGESETGHVRSHRMWGWYYLPEGGNRFDLPESIVDLRDIHTIPRPVIEGLVIAGKRVARFSTPYREHLAQHFALTFMRIGLPDRG